MKYKDVHEVDSTNLLEKNYRENQKKWILAIVVTIVVPPVMLLLILINNARGKYYQIIRKLKEENKQEELEALFYYYLWAGMMKYKTIMPGLALVDVENREMMEHLETYEEREDGRRTETKEERFWLYYKELKAGVNYDNNDDYNTD